MTVVRPFFSFYGGKWRRALKDYPSPSYGTVVEPFAGSAGYSVRHHDRRVVLADLDPVVVEVWRYLVRVSPEEILAIPDIASDKSVNDYNLPQETRWLVGFWLNRGSCRSCSRPSSWMRSGKYPGSFWGERVRRCIASQLPLIRHWEVYHCSYQEVPVRGEASWFVDPPYTTAGVHYRFGVGGIDYHALGEWCRSREGQVIVCEQQGATWLPFYALGERKSILRGRTSKEVVWVNDKQGGHP